MEHLWRFVEPILTVIIVGLPLAVIINLVLEASKPSVKSPKSFEIVDGDTVVATSAWYGKRQLLGHLHTPELREIQIIKTTTGEIWYIVRIGGIGFERPISDFPQVTILDRNGEKYIDTTLDKLVTFLKSEKVRGTPWAINCISKFISHNGRK